MIDDWVMFSDLAGDGLMKSQTLAPKPVRFCFELVYIWVLSKFNGTLENCVARMSPIPLTAEILEKNGWKSDNETCEYHGPIMLSSELDGWHVLVVSDYDDENTNYTPILIKYVHELQHVLRIMRINKEIEL